jgi:hypothetical protein
MILGPILAPGLINSRRSGGLRGPGLSLSSKNSKSIQTRSDPSGGGGFNRSRAVRRAVSSGSAWGTKRKEKRGKEGRRGEERREEGRRGEREEANRGLEGDRERNREGRRRAEDLVCAFGCSVEAPREISGALWASWECFGSSLRALGWPISRASRRRQPENNQKTNKNKKTQIEKSKNAKDHYGWACNGDFGQLCGTF